MSETKGTTNRISWPGFLFCFNYDTTNDTSILVVDSAKQQQQQQQQETATYDWTCGRQHLKDATLLARIRNDASVLKSKRNSSSLKISPKAMPTFMEKIQSKHNNSNNNGDSIIDSRLNVKKKNSFFKISFEKSKSNLSQRSIFSFGSVDNNDTKVHSFNNKNNCISGPANGTFLHITSKQTLSEKSEIADTYYKFRAFDSSIDMVLNQVPTSIPLYHSKDNNVSKLSDSKMTESEASISLEHVCSEPSAKGFNVRSSSYLIDGKKSASDEALFALLGSDSILKNSLGSNYVPYDISKAPNSYLSRLKKVSKQLGLKAPFLLIINFVVPWGNLLSYFYRPDGTNGGPFCESRKHTHASERLWTSFLNGNNDHKNQILKFIPNLVEGPWALRKLVGNQPAMIGQKIPTMYYGSIEDGYVEVCMDVTKGGKVANSICSAVASKAKIVSIDLAFLLQGTTNEELPEQLLSVVRLHHVSLKKKQIV